MRLLFSWTALLCSGLFLLLDPIGFTLLLRNVFIVSAPSGKHAVHGGKEKLNVNNFIITTFYLLNIQLPSVIISEMVFIAQEGK